MYKPLANTQHRLGDKRVCLLRQDSGFSDSAFLDHLYTQPMHYIIALRQNQHLQRALVNAENWWPLISDDGRPVPGIELTRFAYQQDGWSVPRWVVGIRQHTARRANPKGKPECTQAFARCNCRAPLRSLASWLVRLRRAEPRLRFGKTRFIYSKETKIVTNQTITATIKTVRQIQPLSTENPRRV